MINQGNCYLIIIPGFGMISHVIAAFSGKPVFGYFKLSSPCNDHVLQYRYIATYYMRERGWLIIGTLAVILQIIYLFPLIVVSKVIIQEFFSNPQVTNAQSIIELYDLITNNPSMLVGTSETVCMLSTILLTEIAGKDKKVLQWVAGIVDGDGNFHISKKGYVELSVVMEPRDIACLYKLKQMYGGAIKVTSHANAVRWRLHHKAGILSVINDLNGLLYNPVRIVQLERVCSLYNVEVISSTPLTYYNRYLSGLFDTDGSVYYNKSSNQVFITVSQKERTLLDLLVSVYGGKVYASNKAGTAFKWTVSKKVGVLALIDNYFHWYSCVSAKNKKFGIVKQFYYLSSIGALKASPDSELGKSFVQFEERWNATNNPE